MRNATYSNPALRLPATQLRLGRVVLLLLLVLGGGFAGVLWLLHAQGKPLTPPVAESTAWPAWLKQAQTYPVAEAKPPAPAPAPPVDKTAAELAALRAQLLEQQQAIDALKKERSV
jgi:hypothetical protein